MGSTLNDHVLGETAGLQTRTVGSALTDISSLFRQKLTHEANTMLELTRERLEDVHGSLLRRSPSNATGVFVKVLHKFWTKLYAHSTMPLAARVVDYKYLIQDLEAIHTGADGLDGVVRVLTGKEEPWAKTDEYTAAKQEYKGALSRSIDVAITTWKANVVMNKTVIDQAERVFQAAKASKDPMQWTGNALARRMESEVSQLAADAFNHVLNNNNPGWFMENVACGIEFARGSFGTVHHGTLGAHEDGGGANVVIKRLKPNDDGVVTENMREKFIKEVYLWVQLMHPHVLRIYGANHTAPLPYMVCEYAQGGDLSKYLKTDAGKKRFWRMLYQVSLGIGYMHEKNIIHGDLKLNNFVLGNDNYARVTDYTLTRVKLSSDQHMTVPVHDAQAAGAVPWRAPECVGANNVAPQLASDVYSFGLCIYEAFAGVPYEGVTGISALIEQGILPEQGDIPDNVWELIKGVCCKDMKQRPTIQEVSRQLWDFVVVEEENEKKEIEATNGITHHTNLHLVCTTCNMMLAPGQKTCLCGQPGTLKIESKADLPRVMELLNSQAEDQRLNAMQALQSYVFLGLVQEKEVHEACAISLLAKIVKDPLEKEHVLHEAIATMSCAVIGHPPAQEHVMFSENTVERLVQILRDCPDSLKSKAAHSLAFVTYRHLSIHAAVVGQENLLRCVEELPDTERSKTRVLQMLGWTTDDAANAA